MSQKAITSFASVARFTRVARVCVAAISAWSTTLSCATTPQDHPRPASAAAGSSAEPIAAASTAPSATIDLDAIAPPVASSAPSPPPPSTPPYDLAKDLEERATYAKQKLGQGTVTTVVGERYVVVAPPGWGKTELQNSVNLMQNAMNAFYTERFEKKPEHAISVYLFPREAPYNSFCKTEFNETPCMSVYGFYQPGPRAMVMNAGLGLGTLTHELVHPLVEADFDAAPTWLNEGIASVFEAPVIPRRGEIHGVKNWRYPILRAAMTADPKNMRLSSLFKLSDEDFRNKNESRNYALARYVCQWLDEKKKLWAFYHAYRDHYASDPTGTQSFANIMEHAPEEMDVAFDRWVKAL